MLPIPLQVFLALGSSLCSLGGCPRSLGGTEGPIFLGKEGGVWLGRGLPMVNFARATIRACAHRAGDLDISG